MGSSERGTSIASSMFIPKWVKNKFDNTGFDPTALSPPTHDGEFFYVKFPKSEKIDSNTAGKEQAFDNHKSIIPVIQETVKKPNINKPMGIDGGFKGDGESITAAAREMVVSGGVKPPVRGFTTDDANDKPSSNYMRQRRNSKSLPASPLASPETSPRTRRKNATAFALQNRFNLGTIAADENEDADKKARSSWILSGLFSSSRESGLVANNQNLVAAEEKVDSNEDRRANLNVTVEVSPTIKPDKKVYLKKRSEIRELNFLSPVSM